MKVEVHEVFGWHIAALACRRSHKSVGRMDSWSNDLGPNDKDLLLKLVRAGDDHAKAMRFVQIYMSVTAPRYWWQEMSTYRIGVESVSESTMHTLVQDVLESDDPYAMFTPNTPDDSIERVRFLIHSGADIEHVKAALPEGFLQTRTMMINYQSMRRIYSQRKGHKLQEWQEFLDSVFRQIPHTEFIKQA